MELWVTKAIFVSWKRHKSIFLLAVEKNVDKILKTSEKYVEQNLVQTKCLSIVWFEERASGVHFIKVRCDVIDPIT